MIMKTCFVGDMDTEAIFDANEVHARSLDERQHAAIDRLRSGGNLWLATASDGQGPHLIPVSFWWDGSRLTTSTFERSRTLNNVQAQPRVRASIGSTTDVLMIDATAAVVPGSEIDPAAAEGYARASRIPQSTPGFIYMQLAPDRVQVWKGPAEFAGRTVMRAGAWLDEPID